jgi:hypothetical protein
MADVVGQAVRFVEQRCRSHGEGQQTLRKLAKGDDDLDAGIALALLGDAAQAHIKLTGAVHDAYREQANGFDGLTAAEAADRRSPPWRPLVRLFDCLPLRAWVGSGDLPLGAGCSASSVALAPGAWSGHYACYGQVRISIPRCPSFGSDP